MPQRLLTIFLAVAPFVHGADAATDPNPLGKMSYLRAVSEPASLTLLGAFLLGLTKLLRKKLKESKAIPEIVVGKQPPRETVAEDLAEREHSLR
jgi:hypothetical protein